MISTTPAYNKKYVKTPDGIEWVWFPDTGVWMGFVPGVDGCFEYEWDGFREKYPEVSV